MLHVNKYPVYNIVVGTEDCIFKNFSQIKNCSIKTCCINIHLNITFINLLLLTNTANANY